MASPYYLGSPYQEAMRRARLARALRDNSDTTVNSPLADDSAQPQQPRQQIPPTSVHRSTALTTVPSTSVLRSNAPTTVPPNPAKLEHEIKHYGRDAKNFVPTEYTWDSGPSNMPGTVDYYKSPAFRKKKKAGMIQVPGSSTLATEDVLDEKDEVSVENSAKSDKPKSLVMIFSKTGVRRAGVIDEKDEMLAKKSATSAKPKSLVMIFGRTNVRRASDKRKVHTRLQRHNRRAKVWRKLNGEEALFDWD